MSRLTSATYVWKTGMFVFLRQCATCKHGMHNCTPHPSLFRWRFDEAVLPWLQGFRLLHYEVDETNGVMQPQARWGSAAFNVAKWQNMTLRSEIFENQIKPLQSLQTFSYSPIFKIEKRGGGAQLMIPLIMWEKIWQTFIFFIILSSTDLKNMDTLETWRVSSRASEMETKEGNEREKKKLPPPLVVIINQCWLRLKFPGLSDSLRAHTEGSSPLCIKAAMETSTPGELVLCGESLERQKISQYYSRKKAASR